MVIWASIWTLAGIAGAVMFGVVALLVWWSYEAGVWWLVLPFVGLMVALSALSAQKKRADAKEDEDEGEGDEAPLTDMESFELQFRR